MQPKVEIMLLWVECEDVIFVISFILEVDHMIFSEKLQLLRKNKGLTQEEPAEKVCVSRPAIAKWESGVFHS